MATDEKRDRCPQFSKRLKLLQGNLSNKKFADFLGMSRQTVGFYLNGDRIPDIEIAAKIAQYFGVSTDWLLGLTDKKEKPLKQQGAELMERNQFTFYRSYYEAIQHLKKQDQAAVYSAICAYALDEQEPNLTGAAAAAFTLIRPTLDTGRRKAENRMKKEPDNSSGTSVEQTNNKRVTKQKQIKNKPEQTGKEKEKEREVEGEREIEREIEKESSLSSPLPPLGEKKPKERPVKEDPLAVLSPALSEATKKWLKYKAERRETYKPTGLQSLVSRIRANADQYGETAVVALIEQSMASNYAGITWDRLPQQGKQSVKVPGGNVDWDHHEPSDWQRDAIRRMMGEPQTDGSKAPPEDPNVQAALDSLKGETMVTTAILQRRLKIGYAEAERVMARLESIGAVGPYNGGKPREVLVKPEATL